MRLSEYMDYRLIYLDVPAKDKNEAITAVIELMKKNKALENSDEFLEEVFQRESLGSTGIGKGVAIPHTRTKSVKKIIIAFARLDTGIDFGAEDGEPVRILFVIGTPTDTVGEYLKILAKLSKILKESSLRKKLLKAKSAQEVLDQLIEAENVPS
ncbi:PTS sugar transporter subunit IIA [candidate division KSB1 bacterium]|nr:PTS sugar transporter subunit IIA [candidate division KSB1 bacterium]